MIARRVSRVARTIKADPHAFRRSTPAAVDFAEFSATLRAAVKLAPHLPPRAWAAAATTTWIPPSPADQPRSVNFAETLAHNGNALAHLAAVFTLHMPGAERLSRRAQRCALATIERETRDLRPD